MTRDKKVIECGLTHIISGSVDKDLMAPVTKLPVSCIISGKYQPRTEFKTEELADLAASIKEQGILQPVIVRKTGTSGQFELIAGERRLRAAKLCDLDEVPVVCLDIDENKAHVAALVENIQRADLNPIEEATSYKKIIDLLQITHEELAQVVGCKRSAISNMLRLLNLDAYVQGVVKDQVLSVGHAKVLMTLNSDEQVIWAKKVCSEGFTVRKLEQLVNKVNLNKHKKRGVNMESNEAKELQNILKNILGFDISVSCKNKNFARVSKIEISDFATLTKLVEALSK